MQGLEAAYPPDNMNADASLINWMAWEQQYASAKKMADDVQRNPFDILAEERGSAVALQGKTAIIGKKTFTLNYSSITQNAYNNNEQIQDKYRVMGYQGAFSYTNIDMPLIENFTPEEEGNIHLIAVVTAETVFSSGINRIFLNIGAQDIYRPENAENKHDILYRTELQTSYTTENEWQARKNEAVGFKRRYSEYFSLPCNVNGDMTEEGYYRTGNDINGENSEIDLNQVNLRIGQIDSNNTYQFFENNPYSQKLSESRTMKKKIWKDYSDFQINKNLANPNEIKRTQYFSDNEGGSFVDGQNQIFYVGKLEMITTLPINSAIKNNYQTWGEH